MPSIYLPLKYNFRYFVTKSLCWCADMNCYQDIQRPLLREEGDGVPASSGTQ